MKKKVFVVLVLAIAVVSAVLFACSQTPTTVPVRTFERAQRVDVACLQLVDPVTGEPIIPRPRPQEECAPVPPNVNGGRFANQLFALVTQTTRGEVAVVNLSAGGLQDLSRTTPGVNFLPVGGLPTDVATTPDGAMAFVASAEPNKPAIYGVPTRRILGDKGFVADPEGPVALTSWPVCALPQAPGVLTVVPRRSASAPADAGAEAGDAGDAGAAADDAPPYELVAVLPGDRRSSAKVVTIDPRPFLRGAGVDTVVRDGRDEPVPPGPVLAPGSLAPCPVTAAVELVGDDALPAEFVPGRRWDDGLPYVDGGVDLACELPAQPASCGPSRCCLPDGALPDGGPCEAPGPADASAVPLELPPLDTPRLAAAARDDQWLFVADVGVPLVHVLDLSTPGAPRELPPYLATSLTDPSRVVSIKDLAVSPPTRDYKRYLYAVDEKDGSIIVFDATDPRTAQRTPLTRPYPELNPFQPPDRIGFASPVAAVAFARHDFPLALPGNASAISGAQCNPNPNVVSNAGEIRDPGFYYRASSGELVGLGPERLRGVFAFATLANGSVAVLDVDDWDAPCRRPAVLARDPGQDAPAPPPFSSLAVPQPPPTGPADLDPYHAPVVAQDVVSDEAFFPVSAPHRLRSSRLLRDDTQAGAVPFVAGLPTVEQAGAPLPLGGPDGGVDSRQTPRLRPTALAGAQADDIGVRMSFEVPDVHIDQDWTVTYEGELPGFEGLVATVDTTDAYQSLELRQPQAQFCARGVEDWTLGTERAQAVAAALAETNRPAAPARYSRQVVDYVQIVDELLPRSDGYWSMPDDPGGCWDPALSSGSDGERASRRYEACSATFGSPGDQRTERDLPILEAYDGRLVLGRFFTPPATGGVEPRREVVYTDPSNAAYLKLVRCCFHNQARFRVRAGSQWVTIGAAYGFMSHLVSGEGGRCVPSCEPREALLNGRAPALPAAPGVAAPPRDSVLAMRNPVFSFYVENGLRDGRDVAPLRDTQWRFATRGQFQPLVINLAGSTISVNPQSMRYIETLGQIAVVDAASQGLVLIDLGGVTIARAPYF